MKFTLKKPCQDCPFRKDCSKVILPEYRAEELAGYGLEDKTFPCHMAKEDVQCVGSLHLTDKVRGVNSNFLFRLAQMWGFFNYSLLKGRDLIFDSVKEMVAHHRNNG